MTPFFVDLSLQFNDKLKKHLRRGHAYKWMSTKSDSLAQENRYAVENEQSRQHLYGMHMTNLGGLNQPFSATVCASFFRFPESNQTISNRWKLG